MLTFSYIFLRSCFRSASRSSSLSATFLSFSEKQDFRLKTALRVIIINARIRASKVRCCAQVPSVPSSSKANDCNAFYFFIVFLHELNFLGNSPGNFCCHIAFSHFSLEILSKCITLQVALLHFLTAFSSDLPPDLIQEHCTKLPDRSSNAEFELKKSTALVCKYEEEHAINQLQTEIDVRIVELDSAVKQLAHILFADLSAECNGKIKLGDLERMCRKRFTYMCDISVTDSLIFSIKNIIAKLELGNVVEVFGEPTMNEGGVIRVKCGMLKSRLIGWVTTEAKEGTWNLFLNMYLL